MRPDFFVNIGLDLSPSSLACPKCRNVEGRVLPFSEKVGVQRWFLRCAVCGHVWTIDKKQTRGQSQTKEQLNDNGPE
jgi:transposase-like protein